MDRDRRELLKASGTLLSLGVAGCAGINSDSSLPDPTETRNPPDSGTTRTPGGNSGTEKPEPDIPESYRADRKRISSEGSEPENVGNYQTENEWDDLTTNTEQINQMQQEWINQEAYTPLIDKIMEGEDFRLDGYSFPNWEGEDVGFFDQDTVKNEENFEKIIRWYLPAIMQFDRENYGNAPSGRYQRFGATLETLINEHHPEAEAQATGVNSMPAHGIFGVQDRNNEEFYMVDTTPASGQAESAVGRIGDFITSGFDPSQDINRQNLWDPFHEFEPGQTELFGYSTKSEKGIVGLINFVENRTSNNEVSYDKIFMTDEWMDDAYKVLRNGGSIDLIVEPIEGMIYNNVQAEDPDYIGIYGPLDDTRIAVSSNEEIYEKVVNTPEPQGIDDIESLLETAPKAS